MVREFRRREVPGSPKISEPETPCKLGSDRKNIPPRVGSDSCEDTHAMTRFKLIGLFLCALGAVGVFAGVSLWLGEALRSEGHTCKAICGLTLLVAEIFGESAGRFVGGALWIGLGVFVCWLGVGIAQRRG